METLVDPQASPLQRTEAREPGERLERAVERLHPAQREVLRGVRMTLHRGLGRLREVLGPL